MNCLWVFTDTSYHQLFLNNRSLRTVTIGPEIQHTLTVRSFPFSGGALTIHVGEHEDGEKVFELFQDGQLIMTLSKTEPFQLTDGSHTLSLLITDSPPRERKYYVGDRQQLSFSLSDHGDSGQPSESSAVSMSDRAYCMIHKHFTFLSRNGFRLIKSGQRWKVLPNGAGLYVNGQKVTVPTTLTRGDRLFWPFMTLCLLEDDVLQITSFVDFRAGLPLIEQPTSEMMKKYPFFRRTPRMIYELPEEKISLSFPSQESEDSSKGLWMTILPPLVMLLVMGTIVIIQPRGIFILMSIVMFTMTLIMSTVQYFREKRKHKEKKEKRLRVYTRYLQNKRQEMHEVSEKQTHFLRYHYPSFERMKYFTEQISDRIWERTPESDDFLDLRLGTGTVPASYEISLSSSDMSNREIDDLLEQSQVMEQVYKEIPNVPITVSLSEGAMGLIGKAAIVKREIHQLVGQLAFFHSYHELRFVLIFSEREYGDWEWMKWLPHFQLPHAYAKGFVYNEQTRDQLLSSIYELLRERDLDERKGKIRFSPHFVFIVIDHQLISEHVIMEYLEGGDPHLGISVIFAAETKESLSEQIQTLVRYINEQEGDILIQEGKAVQIPFQLDDHQYAGNEWFARTLRTLDHQVGMTNSIPTKVSFLELFKAEDVNDLNIAQNWLSTDTSKSLATPIGLKGKDDLVELNLHEKAHGPHGLLAGTTGSGKSEFLQTYILSLVVRYHPHEVAFLLIDYKGGGMALPFKNIPHLLGVITNIENSKNFSARALASIKSELKMRQRLFDRYEVNHINDYTDLYKQGVAEEPMPHLFLISDEFAELKSEEPDFIKELVSAARIGRSLGVHLILATQKPGGVIDSQIWSNARFRVALKVQDAADSKEVLKNADAASITVTGRGYLQVGNNEVYELFQSAWSGAPYMEDASSTEDEVAIVTDLGLIPLSDVSSSQEQKKKTVKSEIEVIVDHVEETQQQLNIRKLKSPWLPPLAERLSRYDHVSQKDGEFYFAMIDEPEKQSQRPYGYEMIEDGSIGIFGSSGYGKSMTVMTLLLSFASVYSPEQFHCYIFDFGNGALLPLRQLPHTADYFRMDEARKMDKFMRIMKAEISRRKQLFQQKEVSNIKMYNALSDEELPIIFIAVDNFDLAKEEYEDMETQFTQFVRDGQSLGIYMMYTVTRVNAIRQALMNNLKTKIVHYLMDKSEVYSIGGKLPYELEPIPGRAIIKKEDSFYVQVFSPADGEDDLAILDRVKRDIQLIGETYRDAKKPESIPMLPATLEVSDLYSDPRVVRQQGIYPIGLDEEYVEPVHMDLVKNKHCLILGQSQKGKTNLIKVILDEALSQQAFSIGLFDSIDRGLASYAKVEGIDYLETKDSIAQWLDDIESELKEREETYLQAVQQGEIEQLSFSQLLFVVDGFARLQQTIDSTVQNRLAEFMNDYSHLGFNVIVCGNSNDFSKGYDGFTSEVKQIRQVILLMRKADQGMFTFPYSRNEADINAGFGYYVLNGKDKKIQIPHHTVERRIAV